MALRELKAYISFFSFETTMKVTDQTRTSTKRSVPQKRLGDSDHVLPSKMEVYDSIACRVTRHVAIRSVAL